MEKVVAAMTVGILISVLLMFGLAFRMKLEAEAARNYTRSDGVRFRRIAWLRVATPILGILLLADVAAVAVLSLAQSRTAMGLDRAEEAATLAP
jgi:hypothetical protein